MNIILKIKLKRYKIIRSFECNCDLVGYSVLVFALSSALAGAVSV